MKNRVFDDTLLDECIEVYIKFTKNFCNHRIEELLRNNKILHFRDVHSH